MTALTHALGAAEAAGTVGAAADVVDADVVAAQGVAIDAVGGAASVVASAGGHIAATDVCPLGGVVKVGGIAAGADAAEVIDDAALFDVVNEGFEEEPMNGAWLPPKADLPVAALANIASPDPASLFINMDAAHELGLLLRREGDERAVVSVLNHANTSKV